MFPILVKIGPITIHTYGFMMALGVAFGLWFLFTQAKKYDLNASKLVDMAFYTIIIALIGAKAILLIGNFSYYTKYPKELFSLARSGGVFQGGLAFGIVFAIWYLRKHKIPVWRTADLVGPALALGHGFGRTGCTTRAPVASETPCISSGPADRLFRARGVHGCGSGWGNSGGSSRPPNNRSPAGSLGDDRRRPASR